MARPITYDPEQALDRAMDLFWSHGYRAVSVDDVVKHTGLNRHSLYAHYGSKFGLLRAAITRYLDHVQGFLRGVLDGPGTPRHRLTEMMAFRHPEVKEEFWKLILLRGCLAMRTAAELRQSHPEIHSSLCEFEEDLVQHVARVVAEGQRSGDVTSTRPAQTLARIFCAGFMVPASVCPSESRNQAVLSIFD